METEKDFEKWSQEKQNIHKAIPRIFFDEREIWFCSLGANIGFEQDGAGDLFLRPVLIFKKFNRDIFWGIPLTRSSKSGKYYFILGEEPRSTAVLSQMRLLDSKRLRYKIGVLSEEKFILLSRTFIDMVTPALGGGGPKPLLLESSSQSDQEARPEPLSEEPTGIPAVDI